ncbi:hypothetical protein RCH18_000462 [Flavobacterium sp. PL11]|jgi:hypothetical protein|uniref:hypothetical protein n=1 Tax=Flavobacterium sp. PL11 TaxID=3071717 RepID=UPI002E01C113|nr:hypothetical protein [Flavobacterium sp. PL11]
MNISVKTRRKKDDIIKYLIESQKELIIECHEDFLSKKMQDVIMRLREKNKSQNAV